MISADDIKRIAKEKGKAAGVIEKDYALTWLLYGIYHKKSPIRDALVFKGGTAIRKVFFPEIWRFSEDLDFTVVDKEDSKKIIDGFNDVFRILAEESGVTYTGDFNAGSKSIFGTVQFIGPLNHKNKIEHDISLIEQLVETPILKAVKTDYPDIPKFSAKVYSLNEVLTEKIRSTFQRTKARDYYDVWMLFKSNKFDTSEISKLLKKKCEINKIDYGPDLIFEKDRLSEIESYWERSLGYLVDELPSVKTVIPELKQQLKFLS
ncbi:MAG: nucleotidyl transferase AbiEii/AbiGii toxin family protein [Candidatus Nitrosotenuis sp.]